MSHASQKLEITLHDILRSEFANLRGKGWKRHKGVSLSLDHLRSCIEEATRCHLLHKSVLKNDNHSEYNTNLMDDNDLEDDNDSEDGIDSEECVDSESGVDSEDDVESA